MNFAETVPGLRGQFPALAKQINGQPAAFFDGPAGTQVPRRVIDAVSGYFADRNANRGGAFATSRDSDAVLTEAHRAAADFVGAADADEIVFGANMTTLAFALARSLARTWQPGDEVLVTRLDHDANVSPWVSAAADAGATVKHVDIRRDDCTLDMADFRAKLTGRTKLVAVGVASNAVGTVNPVAEVCRLARDAGALTFLDAVHYAPHALTDVAGFGCDFLACSAYKFFGPHVGILWGRRELLEGLTAYKVRPAPAATPGKWMTGTQNHEGIAGTLAAIDYLADIGRRLSRGTAAPRRASLAAAFAAIREYEDGLIWRLIDGLSGLPRVKVWGITDAARRAERLPTISLTHDRLSPKGVAGRLGEGGLFVWSGNYYALPLTEALGVEPAGMVRVGIVHYNTAGEVDRLLAGVAALA